MACSHHSENIWKRGLVNKGDNSGFISNTLYNLNYSAILVTQKSIAKTADKFQLTHYVQLQLEAKENVKNAWIKNDYVLSDVLKWNVI